MLVIMKDSFNLLLYCKLFIFTAADVVPYGGHKSLHVHHNSADCISGPLGSLDSF